MKNIKIAVAYHKVSHLIENDMFMPVQVGKALHEDIAIGTPDNTGDHISDENGYYCELTALYWLWKNVQADYKGLYHYRRGLSARPAPGYWLKRALMPVYSMYKVGNYMDFPYVRYDDVEKFRQDIYATGKSMDKWLDKYAIVATRPVQASFTCYLNFVSIGIEYIELLKQIVSHDYPSFQPVLEQVLQSSSFHFANIQVMANDLFDEYCHFMFGVLGKMKERLLRESYLADLKKERIFARRLGYVAEILTNVYIKKKQAEGAKVKLLNVAYLTV